MAYTLAKKQRDRLGRQLVKLLRHTGSDQGLQFDKEGFTSVIAIIELLRKQSFPATLLTIEAVREVVTWDQEFSKGRMSLVERSDGLFIRANQGHSNIVGLDDEKTLARLEYPVVAVHGSFTRCLPAIMESGGLSKMDRRHIHFATSMDASSGIRKNATVLFHLDMAKAMETKIEFYMSENGVILSPGNQDGIIPIEFFRVEHV